MISLLPCLPVLLAALALAGPACAGEIYGLTSDSDVREDGWMPGATAVTFSLGASGSTPLDRSSILVFQLPNFGSQPAPFEVATFRLNLESLFSNNSLLPPNVDLYGLGRRASSNVLAGDYYGESATLDTTDATLIQSNFLTASQPIGQVETFGTGISALNGYLNAQYANGAGAGEYVFLRLSTKEASTSIRRYVVTTADGGTSNPTDTRPQIIYNDPSAILSRPFLWVKNSDKAAINAKISGQTWAQNVYSDLVTRAASGISNHQANRDTYIRELPVNWTANPPAFKTIPTNSESSVRSPTVEKFNQAQDSAVLFYLTGQEEYARCAADILHNAIQALLAVTPSNDTNNGGWIFQNDLLKEARVTGCQLPIVYDFIFDYLQANQVYDVDTGGMVDFNFADAQSVFRTFYQLTRDHGTASNNWSALMSVCMMNNLLALDNKGERDAATQILLYDTGNNQQSSIHQDYNVGFAITGNVWPESLQYAGGVSTRRTFELEVIERINPTNQLFSTYPNLPLSLSRIPYLRFPNMTEQISFGDGHRYISAPPYFDYELAYAHAKLTGDTSLTTQFGALINAGIATGDYDRSELASFIGLGNQNTHLQLLWFAPTLPEVASQPALPRTDELPFTGLTLQRNVPELDGEKHGLMCFVGGGAFTHSHASGMGMELYGMGQVMGAKSGRSDYQSTLHEDYYRLFASNNTVIVNGASRGEGGWSDIAINTVQKVAMEPEPFAKASSPNFSFTCSSFADNKGNQAEGTQQRTMLIVRTSPTTGFYVDVFRSKSTVTNRSAVTLNGSVTNQYHDYIYRNIGAINGNIEANGVALPLSSQANRFQNDIGDTYQQPGWRYFTNTEVSYPNTSQVKLQYSATPSGESTIYMDLHMPEIAEREVATVDAPPIVEAPAPYHNSDAETVVVRQIGDAWDKPFVSVFEPHDGVGGGTITNTTALWRSGTVVGVKVESTVGGKSMTHHIITNPSGNQVYNDPTSQVYFEGRVAVISDDGESNYELYIGDGTTLTYKGITVGEGGDYEIWSSLYPTADLSDPDADFDGDGLSNDHERLFSLDPTNHSSGNPITSPLDIAAGTLSYTRRIRSLTGASYNYEYSTTLGNWAPLTLESESSDSGSPTETITITLPSTLLPPNEAKLFLRVFARSP